MVGNHTGEGEVGVSRGKGTEHIEVDGRPKRGVEIASQGTAFITKWRASALKERSASQEHFIDLCHLLDEPTPAEADPSGETYCFERGARKDTGGDGWADVWKRHHFAWEYKGQRADLDIAFDQLRQYSLALENPPLLIVSDMVRFRIRTNWTNSVSYSEGGGSELVCQTHQGRTSENPRRGQRARPRRRRSGAASTVTGSFNSPLTRTGQPTAPVAPTPPAAKTPAWRKSASGANGRWPPCAPSPRRCRARSGPPPTTPPLHSPPA